MWPPATSALAKPRSPAHSSTSRRIDQITRRFGVFCVLRGNERSVSFAVLQRFVRRLNRNLEFRGSLFGRPLLGAHTAEELPDRQPAALEDELLAPRMRSPDQIRVPHLGRSARVGSGTAADVLRRFGTAARTVTILGRSRPTGFEGSWSRQRIAPYPIRSPESHWRKMRRNVFRSTA